MQPTDYFRMRALIDSFSRELEQVEDIIEQFNPNPATGAPAGPTGNPAPQPTSPPVANPKPRKPRSKAVLAGPVKDIVDGLNKEKAEEEAAAGGPKRTAPYGVLVKDVNMDPHNSRRYWARVYDEANEMEGMVEVPMEIFDEYNSDPNGLIIDLNDNQLGKTQWVPPTPNAVAEGD